MSTKPKKRSLTLKGHRTSVSLEDKFWEEFCKIAERQNISVNELASQLDVTRELNSISLASLMRDLVLNDLLQRVENLTSPNQAPRLGNVSNSQNEIDEKPPVNINKPTVQSNKPIILSIFLKYFLRNLSGPSILLIKIANNKNGMPKPIA